MVFTQPSTGLQSKWAMSRRCSGISVTGTGSGEWGGEAVCATDRTEVGRSVSSRSFPAKETASHRHNDHALWPNIRSAIDFAQRELIK